MGSTTKGFTSGVTISFCIHNNTNANDILDNDVLPAVILGQWMKFYLQGFVSGQKAGWRDENQGRIEPDAQIPENVPLSALFSNDPANSQNLILLQLSSAVQLLSTPLWDIHSTLHTVPVPNQIIGNKDNSFNYKVTLQENLSKMIVNGTGHISGDFIHNGYVFTYIEPVILSVHIVYVVLYIYIFPSYFELLLSVLIN